MTNSPKQNNYHQVIKTSSILGFSQMIAFVLTMLRTKLLALILGTAGYGIISIYNRLIEFAGSACTLGVNMGGIRELANAKSNNEMQEVEKIVFLLRAWTIITSSIAVLVFIIFAKDISIMQFGSISYSNKIMIIAFAVLFTNFYNISLSFLSGLREIKKTAKSQILAAFWGVFLAIPLIYFLGKEGIEWSILAVSMANAGVMMYFTKKMNIKLRIPNSAEAKAKFKSIFHVAMSYAVPGILASGFFYITAVYLQKKFDLATMGIYQACIMLSAFYVQQLIKAMSIDFLPSLMEVKDNNAHFNEKISQQMELGVLGAAIGVFATFIYAPHILNLFFSSEFTAGTSILRWQILAVFLRVMEFPLGYATTAKGKNLFYLILQSAYVLFEFGILILFAELFGVDGLGLCYLVSYLVFFVVRYWSVRKFSEYRFSALLKKQLWILAAFLLSITLINQLLPILLGTVISSFIFIALIFWTLKVLKEDMGIEPLQMMKNFINRYKKQ